MNTLKRIQTLLIVLLACGLLAACANPTPEAKPTQLKPAAKPTQPVSYPAPGGQANDAYPAPGGQPAVSAPGTAYPAPGDIPLSGFEPAPGDDLLSRGNAFPDLKNSQILTRESMPVQATLLLKGDLPTPCNKLRVTVKRDEAQRRVDVEVYSVTEKGKVCTDVLKAFEAEIPLGSYSGSKYTVYVNGEKLGEINS